MIEGDEFVFIIIVCIIIVAIIVAALLISKKVNISKYYDGESESADNLIRQFTDLRAKNPSDESQTIINKILNSQSRGNILYELKKLFITSDFRSSIINNTELNIDSSINSNKCVVTVIHDTELKFNCKYTILNIEFDEKIPILDTIVSKRIHAYLYNYLKYLVDLVDFNNLRYLGLMYRYNMRIPEESNTLKIANKLSKMDISIVYDNGLKFKCTVTNIKTNEINDEKYISIEEKYISIDLGIFDINKRIQPIIDYIKQLFSNHLLELKKKYDDLLPPRKSRKSRKTPPYLVAKIDDNQLILKMQPEQAYKNNYKFIILLIEGQLHYIENVPFIPIENSDRTVVDESMLANTINGFFENENPLQTIYKKLPPDIEIRHNTSTKLYIRSNRMKNFMVNIELIYNTDRNQVEFKYTEEIPYIVPINYRTRSIPISEIDTLVLQIIKFFTPPVQEGGASKIDEIDITTRISLPGTQYDQFVDPHNLYYFTLKDRTYRYPNLTKIDDGNFSINLMWISSFLNPQNTYIGGYIANDRTHFENIFPEQIIKWMVLNPMATVNLWFDSTMCTKNQIKNTEKYIKDRIDFIKSIGIGVGLFNMFDIQYLIIVKQYPIIAMQDWPIYSRVDLLRLIAAYETQIDNNGKDIQSAFVYADYTVNPHSLRKVYPKGIPNDGFIGLHGKTKKIGYENTYMIFGSYNLHMLSTLQDFILSILCRIQAESRGFIKQENKLFYDDDNDTFVPGGDGKYFSNTFPYALSTSIMFTAHIRKTINPNKYIYFDCVKANTDPDNKNVWYVFYGFKNIHTFEIEINDRLYKLDELNIESKFSQIDFICIIEDDRVSVTRQSSHGSTGVIVKVATTLIDIIKNTDNINIINEKKYNKFWTSGKPLFDKIKS